MATINTNNIGGFGLDIYLNNLEIYEISLPKRVHSNKKFRDKKKDGESRVVQPPKYHTKKYQNDNISKEPIDVKSLIDEFKKFEQLSIDKKLYF